MLKLIIILAAVAVHYGQSQRLTVRYELFTRTNFVNITGVTMTESGAIPNMYNPKQHTIFLIHGYAGNTVTRFNQLIRGAIFDYRNKDNNQNVIVVDWTAHASFNYAQASNNVPDVAANLTGFIQWLTKKDAQQNDVADVEDFHLVGFGLGAHVAGIAARNLRANSKVVGRITGLDPAGRLWGKGTDHLRRDDANYVEVIHTDTLGIFANGIGDPIGAINFYANGGNNQPGCVVHSCCHDRAFELFAASMINPNLRGRGCTSKSQMNLNLCRSGYLNLGGVELSKTGFHIYRINTSRRYPFY